MPVQELKHPLIRHYLSRLRDRETAPDEFRAASDKLITLLLYEATRDLEVRAFTVQTPLEPAQGWSVEEKVVAVPILRAGLGLMGPVLALLPEVTVGYIGLERDERTAVASQYYCKLPPDMEGKTVLLLDPMLATGGSARMAIDLLKERRPARICKICVVASPEGVALLTEHHPDVAIYTAAIDRALNARKYILPGLGDYGDRLFGTG